MTQAPEPRGAGRTIAIAAAVLAAVVIAILARGRGASDESKPEDQGPKMAQIQITSVPSDSTVTPADGGDPIGRTPLFKSFPQGGQDLVVVVRHEGYQDRRVSVPLFSANGRIDVTLTKVGEDAGR